MTISRIYHSDRIVAVIRCSDEVSHHFTLLSSFTTTPVFQCQVVQKSSIPTELQRKHSGDGPVTAPTHSACCPGRALRWRISGRKRRNGGKSQKSRQKTEVESFFSSITQYMNSFQSCGRLELNKCRPADQYGPGESSQLCVANQLANLLIMT